MGEVGSGTTKSFIFMPGEDQGVAPMLAPGQLGKVRCKGQGTISRIHKDNLAFPSHSSQCIPQEQPLHNSDNCPHSSEQRILTRVFLFPKVS